MMLCFLHLRIIKSLNSLFLGDETSYLFPYLSMYFSFSPGKSLSKHFATSVTIKEEIDGLKNAVFIQGHWVDELVLKLVSEFKINKNNIKVEDRIKKNKKK